MARTRNIILADIVTANGGTVTDPNNRNSLLQDWLDAVSAEQRTFIELDFVAQGHYLLSSLFTSSVNVKIRCKVAIVPTGNQGIFGSSVNGTNYMRINSASEIRLVGDNGVSYTAATDIGDGKLHSLEFIGTTTTGELFVDGISQGVTAGDYSVFKIDVIGDYLGLATPRFFDGIIADAELETQGVTTSWKLDEPTSNTEVNAEGGNTLTYTNIPTSDRELFELNNTGTQWDNISPPVQQLPAVIEIA